MRVVVVGGHGRTGALIVAALLARGDTVVATIRNPRHMVDLVKQGVEVAMLDLDKSPLADFEQTFRGADAIVFAAGSAEADPSSALDRKGVKRTVLSATKAGVKRYVAVSSLGATTKRPRAYDWPGMKDYFAAKTAGNKTIRESGLDWTIIEPGTLTETRGTGKVALSEGVDIEDGKIARADVAAVVAAALAEPKTAGHTFQIVGGKTPIAEAVRKAAGQPATVPEPKAPVARAETPATRTVPPAKTKAAAKKAAPATKKAPAKKAKPAAGKASAKKAPARAAKTAPAGKKRRS